MRPLASFGSWHLLRKDARPTPHPSCAPVASDLSSSFQFVGLQRNPVFQTLDRINIVGRLPPGLRHE